MESRGAMGNEWWATIQSFDKLGFIELGRAEFNRVLPKAKLSAPG